jgi:hypothetical protein
VVALNFAPLMLIFFSLLNVLNMMISPHSGPSPLPACNLSSKIDKAYGLINRCPRLGIVMQTNSLPVQATR